MEANDLSRFVIRDGVYFLPGAKTDTVFEKKYICIRDKEKRLYTDNGVLGLPEIDENHPHYAEWLVRARTCKRLVDYLSSKKKPLHILEVGCGNGWLSAQLSKISNTEVYGVDINFTELEQAARVFENRGNVHFIYADMCAGELLPMKFDVIVFAASMQYFKSLKAVVEVAMQHLNDNGEIHIIDTILYNAHETGEAKKRTQDYYASLGYPEMADHYFHHSKKELKAFHYKLMYNPDKLMNQLFRPDDIFPWICIKKQNITVASEV
jgi:ubiquinone/menaquinone biosynthesis C-methylase UbiE